MMKIVTGAAYTISIRMPWGELITFAASEVRREADGTIAWTATGREGLEPRLDCVLKETDGWIMGWLGGTCDTVVVVSSSPDAPVP